MEYKSDSPDPYILPPDSIRCAEIIKKAEEHSWEERRKEWVKIGKIGDMLRKHDLETSLQKS